MNSLTNDINYPNEPFLDWEWRGIESGTNPRQSLYNDWYFHADPNTGQIFACKNGHCPEGTYSNSGNCTSCEGFNFGLGTFTNGLSRLNKFHCLIATLKICRNNTRS